jgi:hypothetical protein
VNQLTHGKNYSLTLRASLATIWAIRAPASQSMHNSAITLAAQPGLLTPHLPVGYMQPAGRFDLFWMTFFDLQQHLESLPFFRAQFDSLRSHPFSRPG